MTDSSLKFSNGCSLANVMTSHRVTAKDHTSEAELCWPCEQNGERVSLGGFHWLERNRCSFYTERLNTITHTTEDCVFIPLRLCSNASYVLEKVLQSRYASKGLRPNQYDRKSDMKPLLQNIIHRLASTYIVLLPLLA